MLACWAAKTVALSAGWLFHSLWLPPGVTPPDGYGLRSPRRRSTPSREGRTAENASARLSPLQAKRLKA